MGRIVYQPHCSKCGAVIHDKIMYKKLYVETHKHMLNDEIITIYPCRCNVCDEIFDCIEITRPEEI